MSFPAVPQLEPSDSEDGFDPFGGSAVERVISTSEVQREVWLADSLGADASLAFNESVSLNLAGPLDVVALRAALTALVRRHACLRATVSPDGLQLLINADPAFAWHSLDLQGTGTAPGQSLAEQQALEVLLAFELTRGPLFRVRLCQLDKRRHVLLLTAHHIICDGWSWGVIVKDLGALYTEQLGAGPVPLPADDYARYLDWEAEQASGTTKQANERYWLGRFGGGSLPGLELPIDRPRAPNRSFRSSRIDHSLPAELVQGLRQQAARRGMSFFAMLFSGLSAWLQRLTAQDDLVIGVPAAGQAASGLTELVGHCVHLLPIRCQADPNVSFETLASRQASVLMDAFEHQALSYGSLLSKLPIQRDPSRLPLVSLMFNLDQALQIPDDSFPALEVSLGSNPRAFENFELFINASQQPDGTLCLECQYSTTLFDASTIQRWLRSFQALMSSVLEHPARPLGRLNWLADDDRRSLEVLQPAVAEDVGPDLMHSAFVRAAAAEPGRIAVSCGQQRLHYADLDARSNQLANALRQRGVQRCDRVGICLERGTDMLVALLGVLKSGACYVPLDPGFPKARLDYYAEDAQLALLLTHSSLLVAPRAWRADAAARVLVLDQDTAWQEQPDIAPLSGPGDALPADPAYVIYTSGSTGQPKGVVVPHRAVANLLRSMSRAPGIERDDRLAAVTTLSFDIAVLELFLPLGAGAEVVIVPRDAAVDGSLLASLLDACQATLLQATPGLWRALLDTGWRAPSGFRALVGGESLPRDLATELVQGSAAVWNLYGPTETTIWSTAWRVDPELLTTTGVSIGRPIENTTVWVLDDQDQPCPQGVPGEICIGGHGVALGYLERPELTADRFRPDPFSQRMGAMLYRTGDRGRWRNDGLLEHMGRLDFQVKVRGYRIELGEIEAACCSADGVAECVAMAREDHPGDVRLVAYLVPSVHGLGDDPDWQTALLQHLRRRLPDFMLPQHLVKLTALPRLPNGKTDRKALPVPDESGTTRQTAVVAPRTELERQVVQAMETVLKLPGLGIHDDFFALGGHSLLAARLTSSLNRELGLALPLRTLFEAPTAERLSRAIVVAQQGVPTATAPIRHDPTRLSAPLTPMQERIRFIDAMYPGNVVYNTPSAHRLTGPLELNAFRRAFAGLLQRQTSLRSCLTALPDASHVLQVSDSLLPELTLVNLSAEPAEHREARLLAEMQALVDLPFDLYQTPLYRSCLYRLSDTEHAWLFVPHHIIWDGWSFDVLYAEMAALYAVELDAAAPPPPALPLSYLDYAHWFDAWLRGPQAQAQELYWRQRFARVQTPAVMPTDHPRRPGMIGAGGSEEIHVGAPLTEQLRRCARAADVTLSMLTMSVFATMLGTLCRSGAVVIGMPVRGRHQGELEQVVGYFNNLLPIPVEIRSERTILDTAATLKQELMGAMSNPDVPFERLSALPEVSARSSASGLYQASFSYQDIRERRSQWGPLQHARIDLFQNAVTEELSLWLAEMPEGLTGAVSYNSAVFSEATGQALRDGFIHLLGRIAVQPDLPVAVLAADLPGSLTGLAHHHLSTLRTRSDAELDGSAATAGLTDQESRLAEVWARLLDIPVGEIRSSDNFFDLGADSMMVMRAVEAGLKELGIRIDGRRYIYESLGQIANTPAADDNVKDGSGAVAHHAANAPDAAARPTSGGLLSRWWSGAGKRKSP